MGGFPSTDFIQLAYTSSMVHYCLLPLILSELSKNGSQALEWHLLFLDRKPEKYQFPKNLSEKYLRKKWDFQK